jgi:hypothetical protein
MPVSRLLCLVLPVACAGEIDCPPEAALPERARLFAGSVLHGDGTLERGDAVRCASDEARAAWTAVDAAWAAMPDRVRPTQIEVHLDPELRGAGAVDRVEVHKPSGVLLMVSESTPEPTVLWHELGHAAMRGARPADPVAARLIRALEEGVADWVAATQAGSAQLGGARGRDLDRPPGPSTVAWMALALPNARFDPHELGWRLGARLWRAAPRGEELREDLIAALADPSPWPASVIAPQQTLEQIVKRCPVRSRVRFAALLDEWSPFELRTGGE